MKKIKGKTSSMPLFNGRVSDSYNSSKTELSAKHASFPGGILSQVTTALQRHADRVQGETNRFIGDLVDSVAEAKIRQDLVDDALNSYEKLKVVGQGSFGVAILYRRKVDQRLVVFKQINLGNLLPSERDLAMNEVEVFSKLHHPNIISYLGSFINNQILFIEMEYADDGTLAQLIVQREQQMKGYFPERFIVSIFEQIVSGINYMHTESILHRDLKTANVFLNKRGTVKIGDFGISKIVDTNIRAETVLGTPYYFSPEMCEGKEYNHKSDIWSLGCILGEMACLKKCFAATNLSNLVTKIMAGSYLPMPTGYSSGLISLHANLLQVDAALRPDAKEILEYWIPLIYRNLNKNKGYIYENDFDVFEQSSESSNFSKRDSTSLDMAVNYSKASTAPIGSQSQEAGSEVLHTQPLSPRDAMTKRSVLYQLKAFGHDFNMSPLQLPPSSRISVVATSDSHFVVVYEDGAVYAWGEGTRGQLGMSTLEAWKHYPSRVESVRSYDISSACVGDGFTIFLTQSGTVLSCGDNQKFALGHNDQRTYQSPKVVAKLAQTHICQVAAGCEHVLAMSEEGAIYVWGSSNDGALGLGSLKTQQKTPKRILFSLIVNKNESASDNMKVLQIICGPNVSALLLENGDLYLCGNNEYQKLGFEKLRRVMSFKKFQLDEKILQASFSNSHTALLTESGRVITMGCNSEGQRGLGHSKLVLQPTFVQTLGRRTIMLCKCNDQSTIVACTNQVITFWGTRMGIPEVGASETQENIDLGNNTAAFTDFLVSVYKSEMILEPVNILALYASKEQRDCGYELMVRNIYPLPHSVLVLVDTNTPLA